jgi:hypothetical protein
MPAGPATIAADIVRCRGVAVMACGHGMRSWHAVMARRSRAAAIIGNFSLRQGFRLRRIPGGHHEHASGATLSDWFAVVLDALVIPAVPPFPVTR